MRPKLKRAALATPTRINNAASIVVFNKKSLSIIHGTRPAMTCRGLRTVTLPQEWNKGNSNKGKERGLGA
jgi:hypothetical protein